MSASAKSLSSRLILPSEDALTLGFGLLVVGLGVLLSLRMLGGTLADAEVNILRVLVFVLALLAAATMASLRRLRVIGLSKLAATFLLAAAAFVLWLGLLTAQGWGG